MAKRDLEQAFNLLRVGDSVVILAETNQQTAQIFGSAATVLAQAQTTSTPVAGR
jgi:hypothetical protein